MVTSFGKPTVNVLFVDKSCAPDGVTSISLAVPATSIVVALSAFKVKSGLFKINASLFVSVSLKSD